MTIRTALFPPANRTAALVAFLRTFWQTVRGVGGLTILGGGALVINHAATIDWPTIGWAAIGIIGSGILAGALSGGDILANGLPAAYIATVTPADIVAAVKVPNLTPTLSGRHTAGADYPFTWKDSTPLSPPIAPPAQTHSGQNTGTNTPYTLAAPDTTDINTAYPVGWRAAPDPTVLGSALPPVPTVLEPVPTVLEPAPTITPAPLTYLPDPLAGV